MQHVKFTEMKYGDTEDYTFVHPLEVDYASQTGDRILDSLKGMQDNFSGYQVSRLTHSLQSATRAWRDGADTDWVVCALLHDIGDMYAPYNHGEYAAIILEPFIREQCTWTTRVHADFQKYYYADKVGGDRNVREKYRDSLYFDDCADFCERWDQTSFDPGYDDLPVSFFQPMVMEVFARQPFDPAVVRPGAREPLVNDALAAQRV